MNYSIKIKQIKNPIFNFQKSKLKKKTDNIRSHIRLSNNSSGKTFLNSFRKSTSRDKNKNDNLKYKTSKNSQILL